jgi:tetratricopeptide (TPR) repeat protein
MDYSRDKAREFCFAEDWMGLLEYTSKWVAHEDRSHQAKYYQAIAFDHLKMPDKAEMLYKDAIGIKPDFVDAWGNLGIIATTQKRYEEAELFFSKALDIKSDHLNNILSCARLFGYQEKYSEALAHFRKAHKLSPFDKDFFDEYCHTLRKAGKKVEYQENVQYLKMINSEKYVQLRKLEDQRVGNTIMGTLLSFILIIYAAKIALLDLNR